MKGPGAGKGARPLSELTGRILDPVLARRTGLKVDLLTLWPELAGRRYAEASRPERLAWPRGAAPASAPGELTVACDPSALLHLQHDCDALIARINAHFGHRAVARIRVVQKPVRAAPRGARSAPQLDEAASARLEGKLEGIDDPRLRASLERLGRGVLSRGRR